MAERAAASTATSEATKLGGRVRALRHAAGLSQAALADGRFSKEYVSQLERGKTRPSRETLAWLAERLGTDVQYLETGVSSADLGRVEAVLGTADELLAARRPAEAAAAFRTARSLAEAVAVPALVQRALTGEARARLALGDVAAAALVAKARGLAESLGVGRREQAELHCLEGHCRYLTSDVGAAIASFDAALALTGTTAGTPDELRLRALDLRSRCFRRLGDIEAAREDVERSLELARADGDPGRVADALFQAMLVAQREGRWLLARTHAREALRLYDELGARSSSARVANNLAGVEHLLGNLDDAVALLHAAFDAFTGLGSTVDAGHVLGSLADVYVESGDPARAVPLARRALEILPPEGETLLTVGMAHLALGRALTALADAGAAGHLREAEAIFERTASPSYQAESWLAEGDLARRRGDEREAARLYRRAAKTLGDARAPSPSLLLS